MEYNVHFSLTIHSLDGTHSASLGKQIILPFAPFIGLKLCEKDFVTEPVTSISWSQSEQKFYCHIEAHEIEISDDYNLDIAFMIDQAKDNGWEGKGLIHASRS